MASRPFPSIFALPTTHTSPNILADRFGSLNVSSAAISRPNAEAGPSNYRQLPQSASPLPQFDYGAQHARSSSNLNPGAPLRPRPAVGGGAKRTRVVVEIPIGRRKKKRAPLVLPPLVLEPSDASVVPVPSKWQYGYLQLDLMCPWPKCDAKLATVEIAAKHYARHQSTVVGPICGIRRCEHLITDSAVDTLVTHFTDHHLVSHRPVTAYSDNDEQPLGPKPRPPPLRLLSPLPPLPRDDIPPEDIIAHHVLPSPIAPPSEPPDPAKSSPPPHLLPLEIRRERWMAASDSGDPTPMLHPISTNYAEYGPFWPVRGEAIAELSRDSSSIMFQPAEVSLTNYPSAEDAARNDKLVKDMSDSLTDPTAASSLPTFPFPFFESRSASSSSSRTAVSPTFGPSGSDSDVPTKSVRTTIPFQIVPREFAGTLPMTVPLADVLADHKRRADLVAAAHPRPAGQTVYDRKQRKYVPEDFRSERLRRIAESTATEVTGKTVGMDWWEVMFEVEAALLEAVRVVDEDTDVDMG